MLRAVAELADTPLPTQVAQGNQAEVCRALDNFPVQELAKQLRAKTAWIEEEVEAATARSRALAGGGRQGIAATTARQPRCWTAHGSRGR